MRINHRFNITNLLQTRYEQIADRLEQDANSGILNLPQPAKWVFHLTKVLIFGLTTAGVWSVVARMDVVVIARGKLEPISQTQVVQPRIGGVVTSIHVRDGDSVQQGQLLVQLDKTQLNSKLQALKTQQQQLTQEITALRHARQGQSNSLDTPLSPELKNRLQERSLLTAQLTGNLTDLSPEQRQRYNLFQQQLQNRLSINDLQRANLKTQIDTTNSQMADSQFQLETQQELLARLQPLAETGAIARVDVIERSADTNTLQSKVQQAQLQKSQLQISQQQAEVENQRLVTNSYQEVQQQLAALDTQFDATIESNERQLVQVAAQIKQVQHDLTQQDLRSPVNGVIFNLAHQLPGVVSQPGQVLLQVVPNESLTARVQVANGDIANLEVGMPVDVRIDAYPFTEFGSIPGTVTKVGREALPASPQTAGQTVFPVEVKLDKQTLERQTKPLTPGMAIAANIKVRSRAPISYVADELIRAFDSMRSVR
jgi:hemolysin D